MDMENLKLTTALNAYSLMKLPLLAFVAPKVVVLSDRQSVVKVTLGWRTRNHLGVMYFGALAVGSELSVALKAVTEIRKSGQKIDFIFKDFRANFLKRADGDVHFICDEADKVAELIAKAAASSERQEATFKGHAIVPSKGPDMVMTYELTLSVRNRSTAS